MYIEEFVSFFCKENLFYFNPHVIFYFIYLYFIKKFHHDCIQLFLFHDFKIEKKIENKISCRGKGIEPVTIETQIRGM